MPDIKNEDVIARKLLPIIYVLDTSGSMTGAPIAAVNNAMSETMEVLKDVSQKNPNAELQIGVLQFDSGAEWITKDGLVYTEDFYWNDLKAGGLTDLGDALVKLEQKLSRKAFLKSDVGYKVPVIIFMSDGGPTDDWEKPLKVITETNKWFKYAIKIAIAIGDQANIEVLTKLVGNREAVIKVDDLESLKKLIKVASVTASMIGSKSRTSPDATNEIIRKIDEGTDGKLDIQEPTDQPKDTSSDDEEEDAFGKDKWPEPDDGWD